jgi:acetyl esterase/lipase
VPGGGSEGTRQSRRLRRAHAAAGGRILAAGASAGATLALLAAMAQPTPSAAPTAPPDAPVAVVVRRSSGQATGEQAPDVARTDAPPVTSSTAS